MNIMIVDDELSSLQTFLFNIVDETDLLYTMFKNNPKDAIAHVKTNRVDAAFLDINMPEINGVELAAALVCASPNIFIVFITGFDNDEPGIAQKLGENLVGFVNKPYDRDLLLTYLAKIRAQCAPPKIFMKTFPSFQLYVNDKPVEFTRKKSKELLALLADRRGATVEIGEATACLWQDKFDDLAKRLYRDAVSRLRLVLTKYGILPLVTFGKGQLTLNCDCATCDLWDYLDDDNNQTFCGEYLLHYEWSLDRQNQLYALLDNRRAP